MTDILFQNAQVLTQDPDAPVASAVALTGGVITAVGDDLGHLVGPATEVIDAQGAALLPGFVEAHMHLFPGGRSWGNCTWVKSRVRQTWLRRCSTMPRRTRTRIC